MPRLVVPRSTAVIRGSGTVQDAPADDYKARLVKYIPAESMALYAATDKTVTAFYGLEPTGVTNLPPDGLLPVLSWLLFLVALVGTPIYLYRQRLKDQPWILHATISTVAFVFWAYTLAGSIFIVYQIYHVLIAALAAPLFTFVAGVFEPEKS